MTAAILRFPARGYNPHARAYFAALRALVDEMERLDELTRLYAEIVTPAAVFAFDDRRDGAAPCDSEGPAA